MEIAVICFLALALISWVIFVNIKPKNKVIKYPMTQTHELSNKEAQFWILLSLERGGSLKIDTFASDLAMGHNDYMIEKGIVSHDNYPSRQRVLMNYGALSVGEICAKNTDIDNMFQRFMESESHRRSMLNKKYNGCGISIIDNGRGVLYCTVLFIEV